MRNNNKIGGMALFDGLLLRSKDRECIVTENDMQINEFEVNDTFTLKDIPLIRGIFKITNTIKSSIPYIIKSTEDIVNNIVDDKEEKVKVDNTKVIIGYFIAITLILSIYILVPNLISLLFPIKFQNIVQASLQIILFVVYLLILKNSKWLKKLFEYHGAEHKVINAYEKNSTYDLSVDEVKKSSRFHKRCGGNFVVYFILYISIATILLPITNIWIKTAIQILILPVLLGLAYETLFVFSLLPKKLAFLSYPAMIIQFITTIEPNDDKIKIAIDCLKGCIKENKNLSIKEYIKLYIQENIKDVDYDISDILRVIAYYKNTTKDKLYAKIDEVFLNLEEQIVIDNLLYKLYKENVPLQYITKRQLFYNEEYIVNENVLIPRQDSEILVEKAIEYIEKENLTTLIDMCTGSGCIGISIVKNTELKLAFLVDISKEALEITDKNIKLNDVFNRAKTIQSDLFDFFLDKSENKYDIIVSNPPYIPTNDIVTLDKNVQHEPIIALDGGIDGMDMYRQILSQAKSILKENGLLLFEIGYDELEKIKEEVNKIKEYEIIEIVKDLSGNDRVVVCRFLQR